MAAGTRGYWEQYTSLQAVKHAVLREYLAGWFPMLSSWSGRVLYIDTHAGPGTHTGGEPGSAITALQTLLEHKARDRILQNAEVSFLFMELNDEDARRLEGEIKGLGSLPERVSWQVFSEDYERALTQGLEYLSEKKARLAPTFIFVDPFGFRLPYSLLRRFMEFPAVELFINVIWYHLHMALVQAQRGRKYGPTMDHMFGEGWREQVTARSWGGRLGQVLSLIQGILGARWMTTVRMLNRKGSLQHVLAHFTNHDKGRDLMKGAMWRVCEVWKGEFLAHKEDAPQERVLLTASPPLKSLKSKVKRALRRQRKTTWLELAEAVDLRGSLWLDKHLNEALRELRDAEVIGYSGGHIGRGSNPRLWLERREGPSAAAL